MRLREFILIILFAGVPTSEVMAEAWNGIVPLRSTRADVERILGPCEPDNFTRFSNRCRYDLPGIQSVFITYSLRPCSMQEGWRFRVPKDVVRSIELHPSGNLKLGHMATKGFKIEEDPELPGMFHYTNKTNGLYFVADGINITTVNYLPSLSDRTRLECNF
jgi:hypothetical protein